jgi:hypothetical protein
MEGEKLRFLLTHENDFITVIFDEEVKPVDPDVWRCSYVAVSGYRFLMSQNMPDPSRTIIEVSYSAETSLMGI